MKINLISLSLFLAMNCLLAVKLNLYSTDTPIVSYTSRIQTLGMDLKEGEFLNPEDRGRVLSSLPEDKRQELVKALFICGPKMDNLNLLNLELKKCENPVYLVQDKFSDLLFLVLLGQNEMRLKLDNFKIPEDEKKDFERRGFIASEAEDLFDAIPNGTVKSVTMEYPKDIIKVDTTVSVTYENVRNIMSMEQMIPSLPKIPVNENMAKLISLFYLNTSREILTNFQIAFNSLFPGAVDSGDIDPYPVFPIRKETHGLRIIDPADPYSFTNLGEIPTYKSCVCTAFFANPTLDTVRILFGKCFEVEAKITPIEVDNLLDDVFNLVFSRTVPVEAGVEFLIQAEGKTIGAGVIEAYDSP